ncbi:MAG: uroporphyrinogen-III synthase [Burkholderiales bacterium]|nr:uroporphyrinogen-III synthase [Burkholderiales bacterium]
MPRLIVTRPAAQAEPWVRELAARGVDAIALPLIEIAPPADLGPVKAAWAGLGGRGLVVFVSGNAVDRFFAARPAGAAWPEALLAAAPGPGTAEALRARGVAAAAIVEPAADAAQLDSEALWQRLGTRDWRGTSVLVVRGDGGRDWLVERLTEAGARVDAVAAYRRLAPRLSEAARQSVEAAFAEPSRHVWLFSSSEAIAHLEALPGVSIGAGTRALATHPRIAARARQAGFAVVSEVQPGLDAVVACIQSMQP